MASRKLADNPDMNNLPPLPPRPNHLPPPPDFMELARELKTSNKKLLEKYAEKGMIGEWQEEVRGMLKELPDALEDLPSWFRINGAAIFQTYNVWSHSDGNIAWLRDEYGIKEEDLEPLNNIKVTLEKYLKKCGVDPYEKRAEKRQKYPEPPDREIGI